MDVIDIIDAVVGSDENNRCKTTVGFFVEKTTDNKDEQPLDEYYVEKPFIEMHQFADTDGNEYISIEFRYKSRRDEDLKTQWQFLDRYITRFVNGQEDLKPSLTVSLIPISLRGKHSILAKNVFPDAISRTEYAGDNSCTIKMLFLKDDVLFLTHDDELIDRRYIENEVSQEIEAELASTYKEEELNSEQ